MRLRHALFTLAFLLGGVGVIVYAGPGRALIRGSLGDVLVIPFLVHGLGILVPRYAAWRIGGVAVLALGTEFLQLAKWVGPDAPAWLHLTLGSTFDPLDLVGYSLGIGLSVLTALLLRRWGPSSRDGVVP